MYSTNRNGTFELNRAGGSGGAFWVQSASFSFGSDATLMHNQAVNGGAFYVAGGVGAIGE